LNYRGSKKLELLGIRNAKKKKGPKTKTGGIIVSTTRTRVRGGAGDLGFTREKEKHQGEKMHLPGKREPRQRKRQLCIPNPNSKGGATPKFKRNTKLGDEKKRWGKTRVWLLTPGKKGTRPAKSRKESNCPGGLGRMPILKKGSLSGKRAGKR